jgi:hypothetical protein
MPGLRIGCLRQVFQIEPIDITLKEQKMAFKHIDFLEKLVKRAEQSDTPWDAFQEKESGKDWVDLTSFPVLKDSSEYRPKPAAIEVNGIEFDEPIDYILPDGTAYYTPDIYNVLGYQEWKKGLYSSLDPINFSKGLVHLTPESATNHGLAMLSLTTKKPKPPKPTPDVGEPEDSSKGEPK